MQHWFVFCEVFVRTYLLKVCKQWRILATCDSVWSKIAEDSFCDCTNWLEFYKKFCSAPKCSWINLVMNSCKVSSNSSKIMIKICRYLLQYAMHSLVLLQFHQHDRLLLPRKPQCAKFNSCFKIRSGTIHSYS